MEAEDDMVRRWMAGRRGTRQGEWWERERRSISVVSSGSGREGDGMLGKVRVREEWLNGPGRLDGNRQRWAGSFTSGF